MAVRVSRRRLYPKLGLDPRYREQGLIGAAVPTRGTQVCSAGDSPGGRQGPSPRKAVTWTSSAHVHQPVSPWEATAGSTGRDSRADFGARYVGKLCPQLMCGPEDGALPVPTVTMGSVTSEMEAETSARGDRPPPGPWRLHSYERIFRLLPGEARMLWSFGEPHVEGLPVSTRLS